MYFDTGSSRAILPSSNVVAHPVERRSLKSWRVGRLRLAPQLSRPAAENKQRERRCKEAAPCGAVSSPALHRPSASTSAGYAGAPWRLLQHHEEHVLLAVDHHVAAGGAVPFQLA